MKLRTFWRRWRYELVFALWTLSFVLACVAEGG